MSAYAEATKKDPKHAQVVATVSPDDVDRHKNQRVESYRRWMLRSVPKVYKKAGGGKKGIFAAAGVAFAGIATGVVNERQAEKKAHRERGLEAPTGKRHMLGKALRAANPIDTRRAGKRKGPAKNKDNKGPTNKPN